MRELIMDQESGIMKMHEGIMLGIRNYNSAMMNKESEAESGTRNWENEIRNNK